MKLRTTLLSPFGRKVRVAASVLGLDDRIEILNTSFLDPSDPLRVDNPLGKMPVLIRDDGTTLFDSRVIVEYFDSMSERKLIPPSGEARWATLRLQALADGILDAGVLIHLENNLRPEAKRDPAWIEHQQGKMVRGFSEVACAVPAPSQIDIGTIAVGCLLEWVDIRKSTPWRTAHATLIPWLEHFREHCPAFARMTPT